jgi:hypothetical protein
MKNLTFLSMALIAVLMVLAVSCTPLQQTQGDYEQRPSTSRRVYLDDAYSGGTTYLVRDPYTGMYYEVRPYGYSPYGSNYGSYDSRYYDPYYNNRYSRNAPSRSTTEKRQPSENAQRSRGSVLGKN